MIKITIRKADYQPVTQIDENRAKLMFKTEDIEGTDFCNVLVEYFRGKRTEAAMRKLVEDWYNPEIEARIINGFVWNDKPVYLSTENQFNYKAAFDRAVQTSGANLPLTFKLGEENKVPVYHTFTTVEELTDFYDKATMYVQQCLADGWQKKDSIDWNDYVIPTE